MLKAEKLNLQNPILPQLTTRQEMPISPSHKRLPPILARKASFALQFGFLALRFQATSRTKNRPRSYSPEAVTT
jgi:hypothetical protein